MTALKLPAVQNVSTFTRFVQENISSDSVHQEHLQALALQIVYNLRHQHSWTAVQIHTHSPNAPYNALPRPLVSGLPPHRLYEHPDEQMERVSLHRQRASEAERSQPPPEPEPELEWVLPSHLNEKWSLRRFSEVFDGIGLVPPEQDAAQPQLFARRPNAAQHTAEPTDPVVGANSSAKPNQKPLSKWRQTKRVILATVDTDSTVVYYIVHDGIVKPRQN